MVQGKKQRAVEGTEEENRDRKWWCLSSQFEAEKHLLFDKRKLIIFCGNRQLLVNCDSQNPNVRQASKNTERNSGCWYLSGSSGNSDVKFRVVPWKHALTILIICMNASMVFFYGI